MIVADLFKKDNFPDFRIIAGTEGLKREISAVSVIDSPDVDRWMRGGEFLIGSGYIFREDPEKMAPFLELVAARNIAAMGIKIDRYHTTLPKSLVDQAEELAIPLIEIPLQYRWIDIIELVHTILLREQLLTISKEDSPFLLWKDTWDIHRVISLLAREIRHDIFVKVPELEMEHIFSYSSGQTGNHSGSSYVSSPLNRENALPQKGNISVAIQERTMEGRTVRAVVYSMRSDTPLEIHLILNSDENFPSISHERMILRAITLLRALVFEARVFSYETHTRKGRFLENLCLGTYNNSEAVLGRARELNLKIPENVTVIATASTDRHNVPPWRPSYPLTFQIANYWISITETDKLKNDLGMLGKIANSNNLWITLGGPVTGWGKIPVSYEDSKRALSWIREFEPLPGIYPYAELALYTFLDTALKLPESNGLWKRFWAPLQNEPCTRRAVPLVKVAEALVKSDFNQKLCAEMLHLHYNTARNYISDLEEVLHIDLTKRLHRMALVFGCCVQASKEKDRWEEKL